MPRKLNYLVGSLMLACLATGLFASQQEQFATRNPNQVVQKTVTTPDGSRYYLIPGTNIVEVLGQNYEALSTFRIVTESGQNQYVSGLRYDAAMNALVGLTSHTMFEINPVSGVASAVPVPVNTDLREYNKIISRQQAAASRISTGRHADIRPVDHSNPESVRAHAAYSTWLQTGTATAEEKALMTEYVFPEPREDGGHRGLDETGGPDASDYYYRDSNESGLVFDWVELCGDPSANIILQSTDDSAVMISWANTFTFYGTGYTSAFVSTNGQITFGASNPLFTNRCPYASGEPSLVTAECAVYWDDLYAAGDGNGCSNESGGYVLWRDFGDRVVIQWEVDQFLNIGSALKFQAILYPATGNVLYQYNNLSLNNPLSGSVGIDGAGAGNGLEYGVCNSTTFPNGTDDLAVLFYNAPLPPPLLCDCPVIDGNMYTSGDLDIEILDDQGGFCFASGQIVNTITVPPGAGPVQDVNVLVHMIHTFYPDLVMDITHDGVTVLLADAYYGGNDCGEQTWIFDNNGVAPIFGCDNSGCVQPGQCCGCSNGSDLTVFNGMDASGEWTFRLVDAVGIDVGVLYDWGLCITTGESGFIGVDFEFPEFGCVDGQLSPLEFTFPVTVENTGAGPCNSVEFAMGGGFGPGGSFTVDPTNHNFGSLLPGQTASFDFTIVVTPSGNGGNIVAGAQVSSSCGAYFIDFITLPTPDCDSPGPCGCMDVTFVVDVTGSMGGALANVRAALPGIISDAQLASGGDVRFSLIEFDDEVRQLTPHTFDYIHVTNLINGLVAGGGGEEPEASDEALRQAISGYNECDQDDALVVDPWRDGCQKIAVLITDARPGGCDDAYTPGEDDVNAHSRALDALVNGVKISAVFVPTYDIYSAEIIPIMMDYGSTSNGSYRMVNADGTGTGAAIAEIIRLCGSGGSEDECLPEGPDCAGGQPLFYSTTTGLIDNATIRVNSEGLLELNWEAVDGTEWYQIYSSGELDVETNWAPIGMSYEPRFVLPEETLENPSESAVYYYVKTKIAVQNIIASDIGCWPLEEGAGDWTEDFAQDNDGEIHGAEWITGPSGHPGLRFGHGDYVRIPNDCEFYGQPLQVDACIKIDQYPTIQGGGAYYIFSCHRYATWFEGFGFRIDVNGRLLSQVWNHNTGSWQTIWAPSNRRVPLGVPFLATAVINGRESMLLINGQVVATGRQDYISINNEFSMTIGAHHFNDENGELYQYHMHGDIHWVKISQIED